MTIEHRALLSVFFARALPHHIVSFALSRFEGRSAVEIAVLSDQPLAALRDSFQQTGDLLDLCLEVLDRNMSLTLKDIIRSPRQHAGTLLNRYAELQECTAGVTTLQDYASADLETEVARWEEVIEDALLVAEAVRGDESAAAQAKEQLRASSAEQVRGYCRARTRNALDAEEVEQNTWDAIYSNLEGYDPGRGPFVAFAKYRVHLALLDYYRKSPYVVLLLSELLRRYPDARHEEEVLELIAQASIDSKDLPLELLEPKCYEALLRTTFSISNPPHQLIAFGYCQLLEWKPAELVAERSDHRLEDMVKELQARYQEIAAIPQDRVAPLFAQLHKKLKLRVEEVVHPSAHAAYEDLLHRIAGETTLRDYYSKEPTANVSDWVYRVKRRVTDELYAAIQRSRGTLYECFDHRRPR